MTCVKVTVELPGLIARAAILGALLCAPAAGCVPEAEAPRNYVEPLEANPHSTALVRLLYRSSPGPFVKARLYVEDQEVALPDSVEVGAVRLRLRVVPQGTRVTVRTTFFHQETKPETRTWMHAYSFVCGSGPHGAVMMCTGMMPMSETHMRTTRTTDADCSASVFWKPGVGSTWRLEYQFNSNQSCSLQAMPEGDGDAR